MTSTEALYNQGTALIMHGKYQEAIEVLDRALSLQPDWPEASDNRRIAVARAERVKKEGGDMTGGMLGADEIVFSDGKKSGDQSDETGHLAATGADPTGRVPESQICLPAGHEG